MKKRAHGATCRSCRAAGDSLGKHSGDRCDGGGGGGGYQALFREELRFVIFKAEHRRERLSSSRRRLAPRDASSRLFYFSPTYPSLRPFPSAHYFLSPSPPPPSPRLYIFFTLPLFSIQLSLRSLGLIVLQLDGCAV